MYIYTHTHTRAREGKKIKRKRERIEVCLSTMKRHDLSSIISFRCLHSLVEGTKPLRRGPFLSLPWTLSFIKILLLEIYYFSSIRLDNFFFFIFISIFIFILLFIRGCSSSDDNRSTKIISENKEGPRRWPRYHLNLTWHGLAYITIKIHGLSPWHRISLSHNMYVMRYTTPILEAAAFVECTHVY